MIEAEITGCLSWNEGNLGCLTEAIFPKPTLAAIETCVRRLWDK